jgi:Single-strand binding protein family
LTVTIEEITV